MIHSLSPTLPAKKAFKPVPGVIRVRQKLTKAEMVDLIVKHLEIMEQNPELWQKIGHVLASGLSPKHLKTSFIRRVMIIMSNLITREADRRSGAPCLDESRLTVADVVFALHSGRADLDDCQPYHPSMTKVNILQCLKYCSEQKCMAGDASDFCEGCTLDKADTDPDVEPENVWQLAKCLLDSVTTAE